MFSYLFGLPRRWEMMLLLCSGVAVAYTLRVNMSVAAPRIAAELDWTPVEAGLVLSSFYWGYAIGQVPASLASQVFGAKWLFGFSILIPSLLTLFVPTACRHSLGSAMAIRCFIGFLESSCFPAVFHFFPHWIPIKEKTAMVSTVTAGIYIGDIIGFSVSGVLLDTSISTHDPHFSNLGSWPSVFYLFAVIGIVWFPYWIYVAYESPETHPYVSLEELAIIHEGKNYEKNPVTEIESEESNNDINNSNNNNNNGSVDVNNIMTNGSQDAGCEQKNNESSSDSAAININPVKTNSSRSRSSSGNSIKNNSNKNNSNKYQHPDSVVVVPTEMNDNFLCIPDPTLLVFYHNSKAIFHQRTHTETDNHSLIVTKHHRQTALAAAMLFFSETPWRNFFTTPASLTLVFGSFVSGWIGFLLLSLMPTYLSRQLGFNLTTAGVLCIAPYAALLGTTMISGFLFKYLQLNYNWAVKTIRITAHIVAYGGASICLLIAGYLNEKYGSFICIILAEGFLGFSQSGLGCAYLDIAPTYSGAFNTVGNACGAVAGILGPIIVGQFLESYPGVEGWRATFLLTAALCFLTIITWCRYLQSDIIDELNCPARGHLKRAMSLKQVGSQVYQDAHAKRSSTITSKDNPVATDNPVVIDNKNTNNNDNNNAITTDNK